LVTSRSRLGLETQRLGLVSVSGLNVSGLDRGSRRLDLGYIYLAVREVLR